MSSHHIVREKQEPALLILGLDTFDDEQLGQLLEWSPTLIATPLIAERLNAYGIKIDWILTDDTGEDLQSDIKHLPIGDDTPFAAAMNYLLDKGYPAVNIVTDELDIKTLLLFADSINLVIFHDQRKVYAIKPGFNKWKPAGEDIYLLSHPQNLITNGLEQNGADHYKTIADGFISFTFDGQYLFIAESL